MKSLSNSPRSRQASSDFLQISFPTDECWELTEECISVLYSMLTNGISSISTFEQSEKSHSRLGGIMRIYIRISLNCLSDTHTWKVIIPYLLSLFESHSQSYADGQSRYRVLFILAHLQDAFFK